MKTVRIHKGAMLALLVVYGVAAYIFGRMCERC